MATITSASPEATHEAGRAWAAGLKAGDVVALSGDLGAGKTHFVKGVVAGLGCAADVTSPTFTLIQHYEGGRLPVAHIDLYRLDPVPESFLAELEELFDGDGVSLVEWPERLRSPLPGNFRRVALHITGPSTRAIVLD